MSEMGTCERPATMEGRQADRFGRGGPRRGETVARRLGILFSIVGAVTLLLVVGSQYFVVYGGPVQQTETLERTVTGRLIEVDGIDDERVQVVPSSGSAVRLEVTRHGFGRDEGQARQALADVSAEIRQEGEMVRVTVQEPGGLVLFGRSPYATLRVFAPPGVQVRVQ